MKFSPILSFYPNLTAPCQGSVPFLNGKLSVNQTGEVKQGGIINFFMLDGISFWDIGLAVDVLTASLNPASKKAVLAAAAECIGGVQCGKTVSELRRKLNTSVPVYIHMHITQERKNVWNGTPVVRVELVIATEELADKCNALYSSKTDVPMRVSGGVLA